MRAATKNLFVATTFLSAITISTANASPGAWAQPKGEILLINNLSYYSTDERFDINGERVSQPKYTKYEVNPYVEYGLWDGTTVGASMFFDQVNDSVDSRTGLGDAEFFVRQEIWKDEHWVFSVQPFFKTPSTNAQETPFIGSAHADAGISSLTGYNFSLFGRKHYAEVESQYRYRFGAPEDQVRFNATLGIGITDSITLMPQMFSTWRVQDSGMNSFTNSPRDEYDVIKGQISALYKINEKYAVQAGAFDNLYGKNSGAGGGALVSLWIKF